MAYVTSATDLRPPIAPAVEARSAESTHNEYAIKTLSSRVLRVTIAGFWTPQVMADFSREIAGTIKAMACAADEHLLLCDISGAAIQSQPMFAAFLALLVDARSCARRVAFVSNSSVSRIQARRLMAARDGVVLFDDEPSAIRWLAADA